MTERPTTIREVLYYVDVHNQHFGEPPTAIAMRQDEFTAFKASLGPSAVYPGNHTPLAADKIKFYGVLITVDETLPRKLVDTVTEPSS